MPDPVASNSRNEPIHRHAISVAGSDLDSSVHAMAVVLVGEHLLEAGSKAIQVHLGHSSISVAMDRNGRLFPSDMEALAVALDGARSQVSSFGTRATVLIPVHV